MSSNLSNSIADTIKLKIVSGEYKENDRLPSESQLAQSFGVSRTTIREAVKILVSKNVVSIQRGVGTFVNEFPGTFDDLFALDYLPQDTAARDITELRYYLDPAVSLLAAKNATKAELLLLKDIIDRMHSLIHSETVMLDHDSAVKQFCNYELLFHGALYDLSHNSLIRRLRPSIIKSVYEYYFKLIKTDDYDLEASFHTHEAIYRAIQDHDAEEAYKQTRAHMRDPYASEP